MDDSRDYDFTLDFKVRDYECDVQGIVNNAVYQNYLEHARHEYLLSRGVNFTELAQAGTDLVVVRAELDYKKPLVSGDEFYVGIGFEPLDRVRFAFNQKIHRRTDDQLCLAARIIGTALNARGRPFMPKDLIQRLAG